MSQLDPGLAACVDSFAASQDHKMMASASTRSVGEVKSFLSDLWAKLIALGAQVDWKTVMAQLWVIIGKLFSGSSVQDIIAWLISLFPPAPPTPVVP